MHIVHENNRVLDWLFGQEHGEKELLAAAVEDLGRTFWHFVPVGAFGGDCGVLLVPFFQEVQHVFGDCFSWSE